MAGAVVAKMLVSHQEMPPHHMDKKLIDHSNHRAKEILDDIKYIHKCTITKVYDEVVQMK